MRKQTVALVAFVTVSAFWAGIAQAKPGGAEHKVTLCHATGSDSNPFIINEVSQSAAESHLLDPEHHGDCGRYGTSTTPPAPGAACRARSSNSS